MNSITHCSQAGKIWMNKDMKMIYPETKSVLNLDYNTDRNIDRALWLWLSHIIEFMASILQCTVVLEAGGGQIT